MKEELKNIDITPCHCLKLSFKSTEGLNKFTEFLFRSKIQGFGFEHSDKNTIYTGFFTNEEIEKIKKHFNYE